MSTLSGAIANKLMTNTWLDDKISPKYTTFPFLTFNITWKLKCGDYTTTKICKYNAISINGNKILYGVTNCIHSAGITESGYNPYISQHSSMSYWGNILSIFYLPIITNPITIGDLLSLAEFQITEVNNNFENLPIGVYTLTKLQSAISSKGTITFNNSTTKTSIEKYLYKVSNSGVEYGGNKFNYNGTPPSSITPYISGEANSSKRVITYKDYNNIFTGAASSSKKCVREDVNDFNEVTYYAVIGQVYTTYNGPDHSSNVNVTATGGIDLTENSTPIIIPPTITGLDYWNQIAGADAYGNNISAYLNLNMGGSNRHMIIGPGNSDSSIYELNARDIAWNYVSDKATYKYYASGSSGGYGFFGKCERKDNDAMSAALGMSVKANIKMEKGTKIYPGDIFGRQPYITPSILQDSSYDICKVSYLPYNLATRYYKHPTMNRSITSSDGLTYKNINGYNYAVVPVIYIPSTIAVRYLGVCSGSVSIGEYNRNPTVTLNFSEATLHVYKYAYGDRESVTLQRVKENEIGDIKKFIEQINNNAIISSNYSYVLQTNTGVPKTGTISFSPVVTFKEQVTNGDFAIKVSAETCYSTIDGSNYKYSSGSITEINVKINSLSNMNDFILGPVTDYERSGHIALTLWSKSSGSGSGTSTASAALVNEEGIDTTDYTIGSFDEFDE